MKQKVKQKVSNGVVGGALVAVLCCAFAFVCFAKVGASRGGVAIAASARDARDEFDTRRDVLIAPRRARVAPALAEGAWVNSKPTTLESLRGRVVLVDFWTYNCYNCRNTLPFLKRMDARYRDQGLTIIGVHSPEGDAAKNLERVRSQVRELGVRYPVVTDNDYASWRAYGVQAWPTIVILDKQGRVRFTHIGEDMYAEQEAAIKKLLAE